MHNIYKLFSLLPAPFGLATIRSISEGGHVSDNNAGFNSAESSGGDWYYTIIYIIYITYVKVPVSTTRCWHCQNLYYRSHGRLDHTCLWSWQVSIFCMIGYACIEKNGGG